jgi:phosphoribosylformylglycinamidine synthase subunit PurL
VSSHVSPLAGSEYLSVMHGGLGRAPARLDLEYEKRGGAFVRHLIRTGMVDTAHDISGGGIVVALAEMAMAGGIGVDFHETEALARRTGYVAERLFGETGGGYLIAFPEERWEEMQKLLLGGTEYGSFGYEDIGYTGGERFRIGALIDLPLSKLKEAYERDLFD